MSTCYEFALTCDLKDDVSPKVIDALRYMTRSSGEDSNFKTTLKHPLFSSKDGTLGDGLDYLADWKLIIANSPNYGEEFQPGIFGSFF
jgi:hypothetical protein